MGRILRFGSFLVLLIGFFANAQTLVWTGASADNNFFTEGNWKNSVTNVVPAANTINPGIAINLQLQINTVTANINAAGSINLGTGSISVTSANIISQSFSGGTVTINQGGYVDLSSTTPFLNNVQINFTSGIGWVRTTNYTTNNVSANNLGQIKVNGSASVYKTNLRLDNYYLNGCVIRSNVTSTAPLTVYDEATLQGASASIPVNTIYKDVTIANSLNNKIESFILKKGFMVTFAIESDGTGKSKNYIASESDLVINTLPVTLQNSISFIRVMPWNWVTKKGRTALGTDLNTTWRYRWSSNESTTLDWEYVPMSWGWNGSRVTDIPNYIEKYNSTHVLSFNEPDDCNGQSGQYTTGYNNLKLCDTDAAVFYYKNMMASGMRIVSPGCREEGYKGWLKTFYDKATAQDIRIDVIAVHWYDWGGSPASTPNATGTQIFNRFKNYLTSVHNLYPNLPIWITEFNGNPNRTAAANKAFMDLALPYLETLSYVERYNWYPWDPTIQFYEADGVTLTNIGIAYRDQVSTPSIPGATVDANNNLNLSMVVLGVNQNEKQPFSIYPNPVMNGVLTISGDEEVSSLEVFDLLGAKINAKYINNQLLVDNLSAGIYLIKVNNQYSFKFIKK